MKGVIPWVLLGVACLGVGYLTPGCIEAGNNWFRQAVAESCWQAIVTFDRVKMSQDLYLPSLEN